MTSIVHGSSTGLKGGDKLYGSATFMSFAPELCVLNSCYNSRYQIERTYLRAYDNSLESNVARSPYGCCTISDKCVYDWTCVWFYDRFPFQSLYCYGLCPINCCGPPVVYLSKPTCCCCIDITPCYGASLKAAPCNCFNLKAYLCFGGPCYEYYGCYELARGLTPDQLPFLQALKAAVNDRQDLLGIKENERAIYEIPELCSTLRISHNGDIVNGTNPISRSSKSSSSQIMRMD